MRAFLKRHKTGTLAISVILVAGTYYHVKRTSPDKNVAAATPVKPAFHWSDVPDRVAQRYMSPWPENGVVWRGTSTVVTGMVGLIAKAFINTCTRPEVYYQQHFLNMLHHEHRTRGIITVSNHLSVWDDPVLWGALPCRTLLDTRHMRWVLTAADICYTNLPKALFFSLGQCIPTVRGAGIHQPAVNFAIQKVNAGGWVHVFPESRVNQDKTMIRFKWGVGRIVMEADSCPLVIPVWHEGMSLVRPLKGPIVQFFKPVKIVYGNPIDFEDTLKARRAGELTEEEARIKITSTLYDALEKLGQEAQALHPCIEPNRKL